MYARFCLMIICSYVPLAKQSLAIREALKRLGYVDTYHMMSASVENPPDCAYWKAAFEAKYENKGEMLSREQWDQLLGHCQAVSRLARGLFREGIGRGVPWRKSYLANSQY